MNNSKSNAEVQGTGSTLMRNEKKSKNVMSTLTDIMAYTGGILSIILLIKSLL